MRQFAPQAQADLDEAVGWLLDHGSSAPAAARLAARPSLGHRRPDLLPDPFRFWSLPRHGLVLVYVANDAAPTILRVLNTRRDLGPLLAGLADLPDEA